jgi:hypothetical protein
MTSYHKNFGLLLGFLGMCLFAGTLPATRLALSGFDPLFLPFLPRIRQYRPAVRDCIMKFSGRAERAVAEQIRAATDVFSSCESTRTRGRRCRLSANPNALRNREAERSQMSTKWQ